MTVVRKIGKSVLPFRTGLTILTPALTHRLSLPTRSLVLASIAAALEILVILPFVDHLADKNPMIHFTQHGLIFAGGVMMGFALRGLRDSRQ